MSAIATQALASPNENAQNPDLEKIVFIHYYKPNHDSGSTPCSEVCEGNDSDTTFRLISGGIKWGELPIEYSISDEFSPSERNAIEDSADTWEDGLGFVSESEIDLFDRIGDTSLDQTDAGDNDGVNIIVMGDLSSNIIGVTSFWYNPSTKEVVDADMVLNYDDFAWSTSGEVGEMDVQNIVTHEFGHFLVLNDLGSPKTFDLTMYGFSGTGETKSRTLGLGDELGVTELYASSVIVEDEGPDCNKSKSQKWCPES